MCTRNFFNGVAALEVLEVTICCLSELCRFSYGAKLGLFEETVH